MDPSKAENEDDDSRSELVKQYFEIIFRSIGDTVDDEHPEVVRKKAIAGLKDMLRVSFLSNPVSTPADFKRLWPQLFDRMLMEYALETHHEILDTVMNTDEGENDDDEDGDDVDDDDEDTDGDEIPF